MGATCFSFSFIHSVKVALKKSPIYQEQNIFHTYKTAEQLQAYTEIHMGETWVSIFLILSSPCIFTLFFKKQPTNAH
jgi:hypothetical protein